jgi:hypothetical protein
MGRKVIKPWKHDKDIELLTKKNLKARDDLNGLELG